MTWRDVVLRRGTIEVRATRDGDGEAVGTTPHDPVTGRFFGRALDGAAPGEEDPDAPSFTILEGGAPVGRVWFRPGARPFEVGYYVRTDRWGRGIATAALTLVADWFLAHVAPEVVLFTHPENIASQRVAARAGFVRDGTIARYASFRDGTTEAIRFVRRAAAVTTSRDGGGSVGDRTRRGRTG